MTLSATGGELSAKTTGEVQYAQRAHSDSERFWFQANDRTSNIEYIDVAVPVHDARPLIGKTSVDREGFEIHEAETIVTSWDDEDEVRRVYYPEAVEVVKAATGAKHALVFDCTFRRIDEAQRQAPGRPAARGAAKGVHSDFTAASARKRLEMFVGKEVAERAGRFSIVNLWRPLVDVVLDMPLGLLDATTVSSSDLCSYDLIFPDRIGETFTVHQSPNHRWFYVPKQRKTEVILFKQFDSDESKTRFTPHSAFADSNAPPPGSFAPRESIELRLFVFYDANDVAITAPGT